MGDLFRSQEMTLCQLFLQAEAAFACVSELGELGLVQFRDLKPDTNAFQRKFVNEIRRCDEMERKLRYLEKEIKKDSVPVLDTGDNPEAPNPREMVDLEANLEKLENELRDVNANEESLKRNYLELTELKHILRKTQTFFEETVDQHRGGALGRALGAGGSQRQRHQSDERASLIGAGGSAEEAWPQAGGLQLHLKLISSCLCTLIDLTAIDQNPPKAQGRVTDEESWSNALYRADVALTASGGGVGGGDSAAAEEAASGGGRGFRFEFLAGVLLRERLPAFERMLWRVCRGNVFLKQADIDVPLEDPASGDEVLKAVFIVFFQGDQLKSRVKKICEGFRASLYPCPDSQAERREMAISVMTRIEDLNTVLNTTVDHRRRLLMSAAKNLRLWFIKVGKIKAIYHTLNMFNVEATSKCLIGEAWCAVDDLDKIHLALRSSATVPGRPSRRGTERAGSSVPPILNRMTTREAPPTYFRVNKLTVGFQNIIDAYGVASYREANPTPFAVITFPFLFAVMYGDFGHGALMFLAALPRRSGPPSSTARYIILLMGLFSVYTGLIYNDVFSHSVNIFGSGWSVKGQFSNMSIDQASVVLGVIHMVFGVCVGLTNHLYRRDFLSVIGEFVPQLLFMMAMFGYLVILIVYKWIAYSGQNSNCAPNLL
uniref:V-type proton ATPase subunit a n=1 Tax=Macrostomum lignano TaxID=282301 RepID=A0A1I8IUC7_9PLAT